MLLMVRLGRILIPVLLVSVVVLSICLVSCSNSGSTIIPETTKVLDEASLDSLSGASVNSSTLIFGDVTTQMNALSVGNVIVCGVSEFTPYGLLRKVTNISTDDSQMIVETVNATLEDAIQECTVDTNWSLQSDGTFVPLEGQETAARNILSTEMCKELTASALASGEGFYLHLDDVPLFDGITADVWVYGDVDFNIGWTIRDWKLVEAHSKATVSMTSEVELSCDVTVAEIHPKIELHRQYLSPFTIMVGPFPVVILPILSINIGMDGEVSAGITADVTGSAALTAGVRYSNDIWSPISSFSTSYDWQQPTVTAGCEVKVYAGPQISFLLYGGAGPYTEVRGYLEVDADIFRTPWWELYGGLEADVGFKVEAMGHRIADYEKPLAIGYRVLLAHAEIETPVTFLDANLEAAIREAIGKPTGPIYLSELAGLARLVAHERDIINLTGLEHCIGLTLFCVSFNRIADIAPLANLTNLTNLDIDGNEISDISPLAYLTNLTILSLGRNQIIDISSLANLTNLTSLSASYNQINNILPLANLTNLDFLQLPANQISNISPLASLINLEMLELSHNQISDISTLANLTNLMRLYLWNNQISDIEPLAGLTKLDTLDLSDNQISDISPLANLNSLEWLYIDGNQIGDIEPLVRNPGLSAGDIIYLRDNPLSSDSINIYIPELEARGVTIYY